MPHSSAEGSFLAQPLRSLTRFVLRAPGTFLTIAVLLALVAILVTVRGLEFKTSRLDLLNPASEYNQRWLEYLDEFGDRDDAVVVVRGPNVDVVTSAIDAVAERLRAETAHVDSVFDRIDLGEIYARGMHFLPISDVRRIERFIDQYEPVLVGRWSVTTGTGQLERAVQQLAAAAESNPAEGDSAPDQMTELASHISRISDSLSTALQTPGGYRSIAPPPADPPLPNVNYLLDDDGRLGFVMFKIRRGEEQFAPGSAAIQNVRRILREVQADRSTVRLGLTGLPVMEFDEMQ